MHAHVVTHTRTHPPHHPHRAAPPRALAPPLPELRGTPCTFGPSAGERCLPRDDLITSQPISNTARMTGVWLLGARGTRRIPPGAARQGVSWVGDTHSRLREQNERQSGPATCPSCLDAWTSRLQAHCQASQGVTWAHRPLPPAVWPAWSCVSAALGRGTVPSAALSRSVPTLPASLILRGTAGEAGRVEVACARSAASDVRCVSVGRTTSRPGLGARWKHRLPVRNR